MNYYPDALKAIVAYCEALNASEQALTGDGLPFIKVAPLTDEYGTDYGTLRDEIGGSWSWFPPTPPEVRS